MAEPIGGLSAIAPNTQQEEPASAPEPQVDPVAAARAELDSSRRELINIQRSLFDSLESRVSQPADMLLALSAGFGSPTRGGGFGESFGTAAQSLQKYRSEEEARAQQLAKMRLELGVQQMGMRKEAYDLAKRDQAFSLLMKAGINPNSLNNPSEIPHSQLRALPPNVYMAISSLDPEVGKVVKNAFDMSVEMEKLVREDFKNGMAAADLIAKYGPQAKALIPASGYGQTVTPGGAPAAPAEPTPPAKAPVAEAGKTEGKPAAESPFKISPEEQTKRDRNALNILYEERKTNPNDPDLKKQIADLEKRLNVQPTAPSSPKEEDPLSISEQQKLIAQRAAQRDKEFEPQRAQIISWEPTVIGRANVELNELRNIAKNYPRIFNVLGGSGYFEALGKAAQEGAQAGRLGTFSLPIDTFVRGATLSKDEKIAAARASQILANQFFLNAKDSKTVLGPAISNSDTMLMKAPLATMESPDKFISYWASENILFNAQRMEMNRSFLNFESSKGNQAPLRSYFMPNGPHESIANKYTRLYQTLVNNYSPYGRK